MSEDPKEAERPHAGTPSTDLTIAICTADRPELCGDLLDALAAAPPGAWTREVLVVDNGRARPVPDATLARAARGGLAIRRVVAAPANIARARNVALREASAPLVLWLDDDQLVAPGFFGDLERAWHHRPAGSDGLRLGVRPAFDGPVSPATRAFFTPRVDAEGAPVARRTFATNGLLVRRAALLAVPGPAPDGPFDPWFGTRGGEDTELFLRAAAAGLRLTCTHLAAVVERVPAARARWAYMRERAFRIGFTDTILELRRRSPRRVGAAALLALGLDLALLPWTLADRDARLEKGLAVSRQAGKLWALLGRDFEHYLAP